MKTLTLCLFCIISCMHPAHTQIPAIAWEKELAVNVPHYFSDVLELPDGNFILLGAIEQHGESKFDIWLLEIAGNGDTIKTRTYENKGLDIPMRILPNGDSGYLLAYVNKTEDQDYKSRLMAVGTDFSLQWTVEAEQTSVIVRTDIAADNTGHIWWLNTVPGPGGKPEMLLNKLDAEGNILSEFEFGDYEPAEGYAVRALPDGTLGVSCMVLPDNEKSFVRVIRINQEGKMLWEATIPNANKNLTPQCLCCSPDNNLLLGGWAGLCYNPDAPAEEQIWDYDYLLSKIDQSGKVLWTQNYNREGSEKGTAVAVNSDGKIYAAGKCETSFTGSVGPWLLLTDPNGNRINDQVYKFKFVKDQVARIICTQDGGLLMVGPGYIDSQHQLTGWIRKLNPAL